jgi:hypothetical protein
MGMLVLLYAPAHMYWQLRGTYALSRFSAFWRMLALSCVRVGCDRDLRRRHDRDGRALTMNEIVEAAGTFAEGALLGRARRARAGEGDGMRPRPPASIAARSSTALLPHVRAARARPQDARGVPP